MKWKRQGVGWGFGGGESERRERMDEILLLLVMMAGWMEEEWKGIKSDVERKCNSIEVDLRIEGVLVWCYCIDQKERKSER